MLKQNGRRRRANEIGGLAPADPKTKKHPKWANKAKTSVYQAMARCNNMWDRALPGKRRAGGARSQNRHKNLDWHLVTQTQSCSRCRQAALARVNPGDLQRGSGPAQPVGSGYGWRWSREVHAFWLSALLRPSAARAAHRGQAGWPAPRSHILLQRAMA